MAMRTRLIRLRWRRRLRKGQRQVEDLGVQAEKQIEQNLLKRFDRLINVKRFVAAWVSLMLILIGAVVAQNFALGNYYQTVRTVPGGIYTEGVKGRFTNANPLYATSAADASVSRLIFAGLMRYDEHGRLTGDLAQSYKIDSSGMIYTITLRPDLTWHDGRPLTSEDVVFTYQTIQNPDAKSPLQSSWQGIEITAPDKRTVVFKLPGILAPFANNLTNGIVPKHLLASVPARELRSAQFNTVGPVGAGPFAWEAVEVKGSIDPKTAQQHIALLPFENYALGKPKLQKFVVQVFADHEQLIEAFASKRLTGVEGLPEVPESVKGTTTTHEHSLMLRAATMVFFKTTQGILNDKAVRQALVEGTNVPRIVKQLGYNTRQVKSPLLAGQLAYDPKLTQPGYNLKAASAKLDAAGWQTNKSGTRSKDGRPLVINLTVADNPEHRRVAKQLLQQWKLLGVKLNPQFLNPTDFQNALTHHDYESILNGIAIGPDPDVFVYWDSTQADVRSANRLNLSEYNNPKADTALEAGRTRHDAQIRIIKYRPFLEAWRDDSPAIGLYQPRVLYLTNGHVNGLTQKPINTAVDRFSNVHNWQIREARVTDTQKSLDQ